MGVHQDWLHLIVEGVMMGVVCVFGMAANTVSSYVLVRYDKELDLSKVFVRLLVALMTYDSVFLFGLLFIFCFPLTLGDVYRRQVYPAVVPYILPVIQISLTGKPSFVTLGSYMWTGSGLGKFLGKIFPY